MGCIQSGTPLNIIRLTYTKNVPTARILSQDKILKLMRNPLLRSTGVLNALFFESVIVTESDTDRAFYQEINERLLMFEPEKGIPNCLFINAQNKQTVPDIIKPLRDLGIPVAGIVDIDVLKEGGSVWTKVLNGVCIPESNHPALANLRSTIKQKFDATGKEMRRDGGIELLTDPDKETCNNLFDQLSEYGYFVIRKGQLESWLKNLNVEGHGPFWLISIFEKLGEDPKDTNYIKPSNDDVWGFITNIKNWLFNPNKKGIPK